MFKSKTGTRWSPKQTTTAISIHQKIPPNRAPSSCCGRRSRLSLMRFKVLKLSKMIKRPSDWLIIFKEQRALVFSWSSLSPSASNYMGCNINNSCSTLGQKHDNQHNKFTTSVITNSASAECFSTTWPDCRMHVFVCKVCLCFCILYVQTIYYYTHPPISINIKGFFFHSFEWLLNLIQAVSAFKWLL